MEPAVPPRPPLGNGPFLELAGKWRAGEGGGQGDVLEPSRRGLCFSQGEGLATEVTSCQNCRGAFPRGFGAPAV